MKGVGIIRQQFGEEIKSDPYLTTHYKKILQIDWSVQYKIHIKYNKKEMRIEYSSDLQRGLVTFSILNTIGKYH